MTSAHAARPLTAVVLAAGQGRRYAARTGRYKLFEPLADGRALVRAVCETALAVTDDVVVVQHWHTERLAEILSGLPVRRLDCPDAASGMGASLKCGVSGVLPQHDVLLMLADMPFVSLETVKAVRQALLKGAAMARPFFQGQPGHPVGFSCDVRESLLGLDDAQGAAPLLRSRRSELLRIDVPDPGCVRDIDVPEHLPAHAQDISEQAPALHASADSGGLLHGKSS